MKSFVFLLGGRDLEMRTIAGILQEKSVKYYDKNLSWDKAVLSEYAEVLSKYGDSPEHHIYGIELREDCAVPGNYTAIDHHGEADNRPSSLEQVAKILGVRMDRRMRLVAANDARYIPGMLEEGATAQEIDGIRREDRRAQGIDEETEKLVEEIAGADMSSVGDLKIVKLPKKVKKKQKMKKGRK